MGKWLDSRMTSNRQRRAKHEVWASIEHSIDEKLGVGFDQVKRDQLFAAHQTSSSQQAILVSNNEWHGGCPDAFFRDYVRCEHFFLSEAAEILSPSDFMTLFGFAADQIDEHLKFDHLIGHIFS